MHKSNSLLPVLWHPSLYLKMAEEKNSSVNPKGRNWAQFLAAACRAIFGPTVSTPLQLSLRPLQFSQLRRWGGPALRVLDFGWRACHCTQLSNSNSPLACVIWRCITMRRHLSSKSSSSFAFFRQSRMSGSVDVGSQCFCRIKPRHYGCTDKTSYGKLQTSEINTQTQTWTLAWRSGVVEGGGGAAVGSVSDDTKRSTEHGKVLTLIIFLQVCTKA